MIAILKDLRTDHSGIVVARTVKEIKRRYPRDVQIAASLARILANSGTRFSNREIKSADVASTGGPTSLSTLLAPLFLRAAGIPIAKLGVPGRPAGGIDCVAQVSGYRTHLTMAEAISIHERTGFVHFLAAGEAAPLDSQMFSIRKELGAQAVPTLVTASLLAKKLAVNVSFVGLDIRVADHGNFGTDWNEAEANASFFSAVSDLLGVSAAPVLTDGQFPYQPFLGRAESLLALANVFGGTADAWLHEHTELCRKLAILSAPARLRPTIARIDCSQLREVFLANVRAQSGCPDSFDEVTRLAKAAHTTEIVATRSGFVRYSLRELRDLMVNLQKRVQTQDSDFPDPIGFIFLRRPGEWVEKEIPLATTRVSEKLRNKVLRQIKRIIHTEPQSIGPMMKSVL